MKFSYLSKLFFSTKKKRKYTEMTVYEKLNNTLCRRAVYLILKVNSIVYYFHVVLLYNTGGLS